jgi:hypothetical protein
MLLGGFHRSCAYASYGGAIVCILEHKIICLPEFCHRGEQAVQQLIDVGALICFKEENGLEMVAEFQRECGGETMQRNTIGVNRERFLFTNVYVRFLSICWASL